MRSLRAFFRDEVAEKKFRVAQSLTPADEEAEFQRCSDINNEWNLEVAKIRDLRIAKENAERREHIQKRLELKAIREREILSNIEARVKREKANAPTFITRDNIDQALEQALAYPSDYNFSIDLQGNLYKSGELPVPVEKKPPRQ